MVAKATNYVVRLEKARRQGTNPKILLQHLIVAETGAVGGDAITALPVQYLEEEHLSGTYDEVTISRRGNGGAQILEIDIVH